MAETSKSKTEKIKHPQNYYETPDAVTKDPDLSSEEKKKALDVYSNVALQHAGLSRAKGGREGSGCIRREEVKYHEL